MTNYRVQVTPTRMKGAESINEIVEAGYVWTVEISTERVVSKDDMEILKKAAAVTRTEKSGKKDVTVRCARFAFANLGETNEAADPKKVKAIEVERPKLQDSPFKLMQKQIDMLTQILDKVTKPAEPARTGK